MTTRPTIPPLLALWTAVLAASTAAIMIRYAQQYAPSLVIAALRLALAALLLLPFVLGKRRQELTRLTRNQLLLALLSGFFLALHFAAWISSLQYTSVANSVVLVTTTPLWVALLSPFTIREPLSRLARAGMLLALLGGGIVALSDSCTWSANQLICPAWHMFFSRQAFWGDLLALAGAWMAAGYLLIGRRLRASVSLLAYIFVVYSLAALVLVALVLVARLPFTGFPPVTYLWFFLLALVPQLLGHSTFNWALRYLSAGVVSVSLLGEPIASTMLAALLLNETPTALKLLGAGLILAGIAITSRGERR